MQIHIQLPTTNGGVVNLTSDTPEALVPSLNWLTNIGLVPAPAGATAAPVKAREAADASAPAGQQPNAPEEAQKAEKTTRTRKAKEEPAKKEEPKVALADVTLVVTKLANKKGVQVARDLITTYGVNRATEIKPEDFERFIAEATAKLNEEEQTADDVL